MMNRRSILTHSAWTALAAVSLIPKASAEQRQPSPPALPKKPWKEDIVGSWRLLVVDNIQVDGTKVPIYGPNPRGLVMFGPEGGYSLQIIRDIGRPKIASNDRLKGTPEEIKAAFEGMISHFGTYVIDEASKTLTFRIEASSFPNWTETTQKRTVSALEADELVWTNENASAPSLGGMRTDLAWHRVK